MSEFNGTGKRSLDVGVYVTRAATGRREGIVSEDQLEPYGWGLDPEGAVRRWRESMGWPDDVDLVVKTDEESNRPTATFRLVADIALRTTRPQKALRAIGQYLIDVANGVEQDPGFFGNGIRLFEEE